MTSHNDDSGMLRETILVYYARNRHSESIDVEVKLMLLVATSWVGTSHMRHRASAPRRQQGNNLSTRASRRRYPNGQRAACFCI